ncbi:MAG: hypothetical protein KDN20_24535 [Verrucomicrobiae bacterium]|nr:hypothetical protein [Verrucomicrobiae bacterium]
MNSTPPAKLPPFPEWALDPARTAAERYLIWLLCNTAARTHWMGLPPEERVVVSAPLIPSEIMKIYYLNPALVPPIEEEDVTLAAEMIPMVTDFPLNVSMSFQCRQIQDGAALAFFPALERINLGSTTLSDLSWLAHLPRLRHLQITSGDLEDLSPLARVPQLQSLHLNLTGGGTTRLAPPLLWPETGAMAALQELEVLHFSPNAAALEGLSFPRLREARLTCAGQRDCRVLPDMPELRILTLNGVESLRGIGRFPQLRNLTLAGPLRSFGDLPELRELTCLQVNTQAGWPRDVAPLATLPELRAVCFLGEVPRNYWPLAGAPKLRVLETHRAVGIDLDVQAINAALSPWDVDFLAPEPRLPLPPLRIVSAHDFRPFLPDTEWTDPDQLADPEMFCRELVWMDKRCQSRIEAMIGHPYGLNTVSSSTYTHHRSRSHNFYVQSQDLADRLPELVDLLRLIMAESPHDRVFRIVIHLRVPTELFGEKERRWLKIIEEQYRHHDDDDDDSVERYRLTQQHLIDTAYRLRTASEEGETPEPADFAPPEALGPTGHGKPKPVSATGETGGDDEDETPDDYRLRSYDEQEKDGHDASDGEGNDDGDLKVETDPDPPEWFFEDPNAHPLSHSYNLLALVTRDTFVVNSRHLPIGASLMRIPIDEVEDLDSGSGGEV